ncbi:hypothetical protein NDU88_010989 [Pleurodeles waltl]|uniref:Uncharacterized protein n=1 Tax=Pleurodeles waltl TaxID=8319 RepID=A0AAV7S2N6_PLEWA|nr:hypothetical protein NDU88_010989 [Pleurodeles waltl]
MRPLYRPLCMHAIKLDATQCITCLDYAHFVEKAEASAGIRVKMLRVRYVIASHLGVPFWLGPSADTVD